MRVIPYVAIAASCLFSAASVSAQTSAALTGEVRVGNAPLEGVVVTALKDGSTISHSVVSDARGRYAFQRERLSPGRYTLSIRAAGYDLDGSPIAELGRNAARRDLNLKKTADLAAQLSNAEWIASWPGTPEQKANAIDCMSCHTLERISRSKHDAKGFEALIPRMIQYSNNSTPERPQLRLGKPSGAIARNRARIAPMAAFFADVNLNGRDTWAYDLKTLPLPKGRGTKAVFTTYTLEDKTYQPHDVWVTEEGVYYSQFSRQLLGLLDPKTGKSTQFDMKTFKPKAPLGSLDLEQDRDGNLWLSMMFQGALAKFDRKTKEFTYYPLPDALQDADTQLATVAPGGSHVDDKVWTQTGGATGRMMLRIDLKTNQVEMFPPYQNIPPTSPMYGRTHSTYQIIADSQNNLLFHDFGDRYIGRLDAKTAEFKYFPTPTDRSRPRRGMVDAQDRIWFAQYAGSNVGMLDPKTGVMKEWKVPVPYFHPYQAKVDRNGDIWTAGMAANQVVRVNSVSGETTIYPLPEDVNMRNLYIDDRQKQIAIWIGNNNGGTILKMEPLD